MRTLVVLAGAALVCAIPVLAGEKRPCDLAEVVKMRYCEVDECLLTDKETVSKQTYYLCKDCDVTSKTPGRCEWCEEPLLERISGEKACRHCFGETIEAEGCVKRCWACPECNELYAKPGQCELCETKLVERESRVLVHYRCLSCKASAYVPGKCTSATCKAKGTDLVRQCSCSGRFPHGGMIQPTSTGGS
jgi:hypothetical protein